jgi:hypothetical protein
LSPQLTVTARVVFALVLTFGWGCDYTPDLPPGRPSPTPIPAASGGGIPVIVVPVPAQTPLPVVPSPTPRPVPPGGVVAFGPFKMVVIEPAANSLIKLPRDFFEGTRSLALEFEFIWAEPLTLDNRRTNIQISLLGPRGECLGTDLGYATRLDRGDSVYVANSVARFRTGTWFRRDLTYGECGFSFSTDHVRFKLGPNVPALGDVSYTVSMGWDFVAGR